MKVATLAALFILTYGPLSIADADEPIQAVFRVQISTDKSSRSHVVIFTLAAGSEKYFGSDYPTLKVLVLSTETEEMQLKLSLVDANKQDLSSTVIDFDPESIANFSLVTDGLRAKGTISAHPQ